MLAQSSRPPRGLLRTPSRRIPHRLRPRRTRCRECDGSGAGGCLHARGSMHACGGLGNPARRPCRADDRARQRLQGLPGAASARRVADPLGLRRLEGAAHGPLRVHVAQRPGTAGVPLDGPAHVRLRLCGRLGREHRVRLPERAGRGRWLAQLARTSREHREPELGRDRVGCSRRHRLRLLGSHLRRGQRLAAHAHAVPACTVSTGTVSTGTVSTGTVSTSTESARAVAARASSACAVSP